MVYELHITMSERPKWPLKGWSYSEITGDIVLGKQNWCYFTKHIHASTPIDVVIKELMGNTAWLRDMGVKVIREKVELVVYDKKSPTIEKGIDNTES